MKKIGIMSMQRIYNYGSFLQAYGLKRLIEQIDSLAQVSFLDYKPGITIINKEDEKKSRVARIVSKVRTELKGNASITNKLKFINHKRTYGKRFFNYLGISAEKNYCTEVDIHIIGSDEVFNCVQSNINVGYSRDLFGSSSKALKLVSYAASFGNTNLNKIYENKIESNIIKDLSKFDNISVRDENSKIILESLGFNEIDIHIDPALAFDYMNIEEKIPTQRLEEEKYMIVYGYSNRLSEAENVVIKNYAEKNKFKILCFGGVQGCCDEFVDCNPFELLAYFRDAEFVVTDTFHGTIFSIINKREFVTLIRKSVDGHYGNEEKLGYLLRTFGLDGRGQVTLQLENLSGQGVENSIDYEQVFEILAVQRRKSIKYLTHILDGEYYENE